LTAVEAMDWQTANQRYLVAALGRVREALSARTDLTSAGSTGEPSWPHSRRM
jgi:hypothetical protein